MATNRDDQPAAPVPARRGRWKPGETGNARGRPTIRSGLALAEAVRDRLHPDVILDIALRLAADESVALADRLDALLKLADRGYLRPPTASVLRLEDERAAPARDYSRLTIDQKRTLLALHRAALLPAGDNPIKNADAIERDNAIDVEGAPNARAIDFIPVENA